VFDGRSPKTGILNRRSLALAALGLFSLAAAPPTAAVEEKEGSPPLPAPNEKAESPAPVRGSTTPPADASSTVRVPYLPESVKAELREEIKQEVLDQAKRENWASPNQFPAWASRLKVSGDVRVRFDRVTFPQGNANGGEFPDFNAINTNKPFDVLGVDLSNDRYLNVDQSRSRPRLRARVGVEALPREGFSALVRLATGEGSTPVSNNQTLGGSGGDFSKYQVWLDRAYIKYEPWAGKSTTFAILLGRFDDPFFRTDMIFWDDLAFDGIALTAGSEVAAGLIPFLIGGAFPVYTTAFAYPAERPDKYASWNKWLWAGQLGADWAPSRAVFLKVGVAFYAFQDVTGKASSPCDTNISYITCDTDDARPSFAQKGNSYMSLRTPSAAALAAEASSQAPRYQYFGLASEFRELVGTARIEFAISSRLKAALEGEYVDNTGFSRDAVAAISLNNRGPVASGGVGDFVGGNHGLLGRVSFGTPEVKRGWDWKLRFTYRRLESDAVMDAFNDPDFAQGGTNNQGYSLELTLGLATDVSAALRWFSAQQVAGPRYAVDGLQLELLQRF